VPVEEVGHPSRDFLPTRLFQQPVGMTLADVGGNAQFSGRPFDQRRRDDLLA
jgi:hypothetical protein